MKPFRCCLVVLVMGALCAVPATSSAAVLPPGTLVVNGGFEQPAIAGSWTTVGATAVTGWASPNGCGIEIWRTLAVPAEGAQSVELDSNYCSDALTQSITTVPGATYEVQFWMAARGSGNLNDNGIRLRFGSIDRSEKTGNPAWVAYTSRMVATSTSTVLRLDDIGTNNSWGSRLDAVSVTKDTDGDGVNDGTDNCPSDANADQADLDGDKEGDACDGDIDGDGVANDTDNAPRDANADQQDLDEDGIGDVIDTNVLPLNSAMCKKEGWKRYYDGSARFKNQGDCVAFVATGERNLPAGS